MRKTINGSCVVVLAVASGYAQAPQFEVATVKADPPSADGRIRVMVRGGPGTNDPGRIEYQGMTLKDLLSIAYAVKNFQVLGPAWLDTERFNVEAKIPQGTTKPQFNVMLQNLLADRFGLKVHWVNKDIDMYALLVAKSGSKLKPAAPD